MADKPPILVLQMQRMGDLVLTFPLLLWLGQRHPGHPLWVVAESVFYQGLLPLSPPVTYLPWHALEPLQRQNFHLLLNLSHRPEAAQLAAQLQARETLGPVQPPDAPLHVHGAWQLYRANLVRNNRHNLFHWADLNALDCIPAADLGRTVWPEPRQGSSGRVGLFLGASEEHKRPTVPFWAGFVRALTRRGLTPVLLGGKAEIPLGSAVRTAAGRPVVDLCGRFALPGFVRALGELDLLVTPDTGPMHLGAWLGVPTLNLSMGPVNPWETGPYQPGHHILQARLSCVNCWHCTHPTPYRCRELFQPEKTAFVAQRLAQGKLHGLESLDPRPMRLLRTTRNHLGLYHLTPLGPGGADMRLLAGAFWRNAFATLLGLDQSGPVREAWQDLVAAQPGLERPLARALRDLGQGLAQALQKRRSLDAAFWQRSPALLRPLSGYIQLLLQNENYAPAAYARALHCLEQVAGLRQP